MGRLEKQIIASALALVGVLLSVVVINGLEPRIDSDPPLPPTEFPDKSALPPLVITEGATEVELPLQPPMMIYHVSLGETFWSIAESVFGNRDRFNEIALANPNFARRPLQPGDQIWVPRPPAAEEMPEILQVDQPLPQAKRIHVVVNGDSLWKIAKKYYGKEDWTAPGAWNKYEARIRDANPGMASVLQLGTEIVIP